MKVVKLNDDAITKLNLIGKYVKVVDDSYVMSNGESLVTDSLYIEEMLRLNIIDFVKKRSIYKYLGTDFSNMPTETKEKIAENHSVDMNTIYMYYMMSGLTEQETMGKIYSTKSLQVLNSAKCSQTYTGSPRFYSVVMMYLPNAEAERFTSETLTLFEMYERIALYGQKYGDATPGVMDYIEGYGVYETTGLSTYTFNSGMTLADMRLELVDILINGNV